MDDACQTPMCDHVAEFWRLLESGKVRILIDTHHPEGFGGMGHWTSSSFPDDVAKALVADRIAPIVFVTNTDPAYRCTVKGPTHIVVEPVL